MNKSNDEQIDLWNGRTGQKWAAMQVSVDAMLAHIAAELKKRVGSVSGKRVLDIGCGTGETCVAWLDGGAEVTGVDVSSPMLAVAADRTKGKATLIQADASVWISDVPFDLAVSQFGLMFFADPDKAFSTIATNIRPGGRLIFTCWRPAAENQWVSAPMASIRDLLPESPPPTPNMPGPFALTDKARLIGILEQAGFNEISITAFDFPVCFTNKGGVEEAVRFAMQIGPTASELAEVNDETRAIAAERLKAVLAPHDKNGLVALGGAAWVVEAILGT